jgi:hypothetical protein
LLHRTIESIYRQLHKFKVFRISHDKSGHFRRGNDRFMK